MLSLCVHLPLHQAFANTVRVRKDTNDLTLTATAAGSLSRTRENILLVISLRYGGFLVITLINFLGKWSIQATDLVPSLTEHEMHMVYSISSSAGQHNNSQITVKIMELFKPKRTGNSKELFFQVSKLSCCCFEKLRQKQVTCNFVVFLPCVS